MEIEDKIKKAREIIGDRSTNRFLTITSDIYSDLIDTIESQQQETEQLKLLLRNAYLGIVVSTGVSSGLMKAASDYLGEDLRDTYRSRKV